MPGSGDGVLVQSNGAFLCASPTAKRLDRELVHLARLEGQVDRELGRGLALLWDREHFVPLGSARAIDFVREMLGIEESRARWLAKLGRQIAAVPELDQALAEGRICASQAIELGQILSADSPAGERAEWISQASQLGVRELRRVVRAEKERRRTQGEESGEAPTTEVGPDDPPAGGWMTIPAPARVAVLWHGALELARKASGRQLSQGQAAELVFAEYLSADGSDESGGVQIDSPTSVDEKRERLVAEVIAALNRQSDEVARPRSRGRSGMPEEVARATAHQGDAGVEMDPPHPMFPEAPPELPPDCRVKELYDPWELAATLGRLVGLKRHLRYELAGRLSTFMSEVHPASLGFGTLDAYCAERLGFGLRRAERLVRFRSGLMKFPRLASAYLDGRISYTAALLLLPVLHRKTEAAWVEWADGVTYRELERVTEHARTYALPEAYPPVLESYARELEEQGLARRKLPGGETSEATAFAAAQLDDVPPGCALPPEPGGLPRIAGLPDDLALEAELCIAHIRFWLPSDVLELAHRALDRCRYSMPDPLLRAWAYFEFILVHFIRTHDTPEARRLERRHRIIARDGYRCTVPGCTSRMNFHSHHLEHQAQGGTDEEWNQATGCAGHHGPGFHSGVIEVGGFAPDRLVFRLGINPKTGKALACYRNERRVIEEVAKADLARWRRFWRDRHAEAYSVDAGAEAGALLDGRRNGRWN